MPKVDPSVASAVDAAAPWTRAKEQDYFWWHRDRYVATLAAVQEIAQGHELRVLDVGAYPPHMFDALGRLGHEVHGVVSAHEPIEHPTMAVADIETEALPWDDGFFDLVLFSEVIEHLPHSPVRALREFRRVVRQGGHLVITTPNIASARNRVRLLLGRSVMFPLEEYFGDDGAGRTIYYRHNREYTAAELRELLVRTGWQVERVSDVMSYRRPFHQSKSTRVSPSSLAKLALHYAIPGARDNLLAIGVRQD